MFRISWQEAVAAYRDLTLHVVAGPRSLTYVVPFIVVPGALLLPPSLLSLSKIRWVVLPLLSALQVHVWIKHRSFDVISINHALMTFMLLGWYDVRRDFRRVVRQYQPDGPSPKGADKPKDDPNRSRARPETPCFSLMPYPESWWQRLGWIGTLCLSLRLTDWHIGLPSHDRHQPSSFHPFKAFFLNTLAHAMFSYVLLDLVSSVFSIQFCTTIDQHTNASISLQHLYLPVALLTYLYSALSFFTSWLPTLLVLVLLSPSTNLCYNQSLSPLTWASHFGSFRSIYRKPQRSTESFGLRAFWGAFWHQNMRQLTCTPGIALVTWLRLPQGSMSRYMTIVGSSFFWSGIVHMGVIPPEPIATPSTAAQLRLRLASFFWLQILGVGLECLFQRFVLNCPPATRSLDPHKSRHGTLFRTNMVWGVSVVIWTVTFLSTTAWWTIRPVGCEMKWWRLPLVPQSIAQWIKGSW